MKGCYGCNNLTNFTIKIFRDGFEAQTINNFKDRISLDLFQKSEIFGFKRERISEHNLKDKVKILIRINQP